MLNAPAVAVPYSAQNIEPVRMHALPLPRRRLTDQILLSPNYAAVLPFC